VRFLAPGGGFVFQQVHNIMANVPPENIIAMVDAVRADQEPPGTWESPSAPSSRFSHSIPSLWFKTHIRLIRSLWYMSRIAGATALSCADVWVGKGELELWESGGPGEFSPDAAAERHNLD